MKEHFISAGSETKLSGFCVLAFQEPPLPLLWFLNRLTAIKQTKAAPGSILYSSAHIHVLGIKFKYLGGVQRIIGIQNI